MKTKSITTLRDELHDLQQRSKDLRERQSALSARIAKQRQAENRALAGAIGHVAIRLRENPTVRVALDVIAKDPAFVHPKALAALLGGASSDSQ